jgi:DNA-binding transcriptional MerR regulator
MNINENLIPIKEAAEIAGVTRVTLKNWHDRDVGPKRIKIGGRWFYKLEDIKNFLNGESDV